MRARYSDFHGCEANETNRRDVLIRPQGVLAELHRQRVRAEAAADASPCLSRGESLSTLWRVLARQDPQGQPASETQSERGAAPRP